MKKNELETCVDILIWTMIKCPIVSKFIKVKKMPDWKLNMRCPADIIEECSRNPGTSVCQLGSDGDINSIFQCWKIYLKNEVNK